MSWLQVVVLSIVQGLTEFLPISSSGHLAIVSFALVPRVLASRTILRISLPSVVGIRLCLSIFSCVSALI